MLSCEVWNTKLNFKFAFLVQFPTPAQRHLDRNGVLYTAEYE